MYGIVYIAVNIKNGDMYVGQTKQRFLSRINAHICKAKRSGCEFARAIREFGRDAFSWVEIAQADSANELDTIEKEYIAYYKSVGKHLYNQKSGGSGTTSKTLQKMSDSLRKGGRLIKAPDGTIHSVDVVTHFAIEHDLPVSSLSQVLSGKIQSTKGWSLPSTDICEIKKQIAAKLSNFQKERSPILSRQMKARWDDRESREQLCQSMKGVKRTF